MAVPSTSGPPAPGTVTEVPTGPRFSPGGTRVYGGPSDRRPPRTRGPPHSGGSTPKKFTYEITATASIVDKERGPSFTRGPPHSRGSTTKNVTYETTSTDRNGSITPGSAQSDTSVIVGAAVGGVILIVIISILIFLFICKKRNGRDGKNSTCCWGSRGPAAERGNRGATSPEMTRGAERGPHPYDAAASFRSGDDISHFYETVPNVRSRVSRPSGYDQLDLPRVNRQESEATHNGTNNGTNTDTDTPNHEYVELVDDSIQPTATSDRPTVPGYDVLRGRSIRPNTPPRNHSYDTIKESETHTSEPSPSPDEDTQGDPARTPLATSGPSGLQYFVLESDKSLDPGV